MVRTYASGLEVPLTATEREALPWGINASRCGASAAGWRSRTTRTPPGRIPATFPPIACALQLIADTPTWHAGAVLTVRRMSGSGRPAS